MENKLEKLKSQYKTLKNDVAAVEKTIEALLNGNEKSTEPEKKDYSHPHNGYTHDDIRKLLNEGYKSEDICKELGAKQQEVAAIKAHITMDSYVRSKIKNRELTEKEKVSIYTDIAKSVEKNTDTKEITESIAKDYKITRIRAMALLASYKRNLK